MDLQISKLNNVIINKEYDQAFDANDVLNIQGIRATGEFTTNLPSVNSSEDSFGILHTYLDKDGDGYQQYVPMNGNWKNTIFKRRIKTSNNTIGEWQYVLDSSEWTNELTTEDSTILGAINELHNQIESISTNDIQVPDAANPNGTEGRNLTQELAYAWTWLVDHNNIVYANRNNIGELTNLQTTDKTNLVSAINELVNATPNISFDTFSSVDKDTKGCSSAGALATDLMASKGQSYSISTSGTAQNVFTANFSDVKFGKYSLCIRARVSANASSSAILTMNVLNGSTNILSKNILGTNFDSTTNYCYICTTFTYEGSNSVAKQPLQFVLNSATVSGITVYFDYAYITLLTPAVYI